MHQGLLLNHRAFDCAAGCVVADDNRDAAESLAILLRLDGRSVDVVHDGEAALASFAAIKPDVFLLDIGMPLLSGYDVALRIRADHASPLLIAITVWGQAHDRAKAAEAGFERSWLGLGAVLTLAAGLVSLIRVGSSRTVRVPDRISTVSVTELSVVGSNFTSSL